MDAALIALISAIVQALATALAPIVLQQIQQPSTAQDGFSDADLQTQIEHAIENPVAAGTD